MTVLYANNASSKLSASITNTATSFSVTAGQGALFPAITGSDYFYATLMDTSGNLEIVKVTARSVDTFTVMRGQDGTTARAYSVNDIVELRITKAMLDQLKVDSVNTSNAASFDSVASTNNGNGTNFKVGDDAWIGDINVANTIRITGLQTAANGYIVFGNSDATALGRAGTGALTYGGNTVVTSSNYSSYSPSLTGSGASGTWGISVSGNAATSSSSSRLATPDTRDTTRIPTDLSAGLVTSFQSNTSDGLSDGGSYNGLWSFRQYSSGTDWTGGVAHQLGFTDNGNIWHRIGNSATWGTWNKLLDSANYNSYAPTLTGTGASGTWGISITGNAATATSAGYLTGGDSAFYAYLYSANSGDLNTYNSPGLYSSEYTGGTNNPAGTTGQNGHWIQISDAGGTDVKTQWYYHSGGSDISMRLMWGNGIWRSWRKLLHDGNYNSYAPTLTGGGASGTWGINVTGSAGTATSAVRIAFDDGPRDLSNRLPNSFLRAVNFDFVTAGVGNGTGNYAGVMTFSPWTGTTVSTGDSSYQLAFANGSGVNASGQPRLSIRNGIDGTWNAWHILLHSGNYNSYAPTLTGTGASGTWGISISGNASTASSSPLLSALGNYVWSASTLPTGYNQGVQASFVQGSNGFPSYGSVMTMNTYSGGGGALQMYVPYSPTYGGTALQVRFGNYDVSSGNSWTSWKTLLASDNYNSYAPTLTGTGASGTWGISITGNAAEATRASGQSGYPHAGYGMYAFYNWGGSNGGASAPSAGSYTVGLSVGSHPSDQAYGFQIARNMWNTGLWTRGYDSGWGSWVRLLDSSNYNSYAPTLTGSGASGTWGISVSGNAATATTATNVSGGTASVSALTVNSNNISAVNSLGFRNRIINGDMRVNQRNAGAVLGNNANGGVVTVDRWFCAAAGGAATFQQVTDGPTAGHKYSLRVTTSTAFTGTGTEGNHIFQWIERSNVLDFMYGTAQANSCTVSFWVKSSLTGSFAAFLYTNGGTANAARSIVTPFSINAANTWELKTITFVGDVTGSGYASIADNGQGLLFGIDLGSGTGRNTAAANAWAQTTAVRTSSTPGIMPTTGATLNLTGVQLEAGAVATPFERRPYGTELALCQRYYQGDILAAVGGGSTPTAANRNFYCAVNWPVQFRASPTLALITTLTNNLMNAGSWSSVDAARGRFTATNTTTNDAFLECVYSGSAEL